MVESDGMTLSRRYGGYKNVDIPTADINVFVPSILRFWQAKVQAVVPVLGDRNLEQWRTVTNTPMFIQKDSVDKYGYVADWIVLAQGLGLNLSIQQVEQLLYWVTHNDSVLFYLLPALMDYVAGHDRQASLATVDGKLLRMASDIVASCMSTTIMINPALGKAVTSELFYVRTDPHFYKHLLGGCLPFGQVVPADVDYVSARLYLGSEVYGLDDAHEVIPIRAVIARAASASPWRSVRDTMLGLRCGLRDAVEFVLKSSDWHGDTARHTLKVVMKILETGDDQLLRYAVNGVNLDFSRFTSIISPSLVSEILEQQSSDAIVAAATKSSGCNCNIRGKIAAKTLHDILCLIAGNRVVRDYKM
jgi:hypothetical protein